MFSAGYTVAKPALVVSFEPDCADLQTEGIELRPNFKSAIHANFLRSGFNDFDVDIIGHRPYFVNGISLHHFTFQYMLITKYSIDNFTYPFCD